MPVKVFYTSVSGSTALKKNQDRILSVLTSNKIPFEIIDISESTNHKDLMREMAGNKTALAPQICNGDVYCGDFAAFENAIEMDGLKEFLKI